MYLWKTDALIDDLRNNKVDEKEQFKYYITMAIFTLISLTDNYLESEAITLINVLSDSLVAIATLGGSFYVFKVNQQNDNNHFLLRIVSIGIPASVRVIVFSLLTLLIVATICGVFAASGLIETKQIDKIVNLVTSLSVVPATGISYWYIGRKIKQI